MQAKSRKLRFTKSAIEGIEPPVEDRAYWYDTESRGLALCVWSSGKRVFLLYRKINGRPERVKLGVWPEMTVEQARGAAERHNGRISEGENPAEKRRTIAGAPTLGEVFNEFIEGPSRTKEKRARSPITIKNYRYLFDEHLAGWKDRQLSKITRADIEKQHNRIGEERPYLANRVLSLTKALFEFALKQGLYSVNPAARLPPFQEETRDRFLQADELPKFFEALEAERSEKVRDFIKLALFTGQRRTNMLSMKWDDVNLERATWHIPKTKGGKPLVVPLSHTALEILSRRLAARDGSEYVFPGRHGREHLRDPMRQWRGILERAGLPGVRIHDLRRTFGSWQAATGASLPLIGKSMGHRSPSTTAIYARLELGPVRASVELATEAILAAVAVGTEQEKAKKRKKATKGS